MERVNLAVEFMLMPIQKQVNYLELDLLLPWFHLALYAFNFLHVYFSANIYDTSELSFRWELEASHSGGFDS